MTDDWTQIKARLEADADVLEQQALAADTHEEMLSLREFAADIRAALQRDRVLTDENKILRQRVEELEQIEEDFKRCSDVAMLASSYWPEKDVWTGTVSQRLTHALTCEHEAREAAEAKLADMMAQRDGRTLELLAENERHAETAHRLRELEDLILELRDHTEFYGQSTGEKVYAEARRIRGSER